MTNTLDKLLSSRWFWPLLIGLNLLLHLPFFNQPPNSVHVWRQSNTMAVARNFYDEGMNILRPRVDRRLSTDGITGMQFPSYEWAVAVGYKALGFSETIPRVVNWLFFVFGLVGFYGLVRHLTASRWLAAVGAWGLSWSPEMFYHSINALPDVLALSASLWGLWYFLRWYREPRISYFLISLFCTTLGGLTKLQYLVVGAPIAVLILRDMLQGRFEWRRLGWLTLFAVVSVGATLGWYAYALQLMETSGLYDYGLEVRPAPSLSKALEIIRQNLVSDLPETLLNFASFGLLLLGLWAWARTHRASGYWFLPLAGWAASLAVYYVLELTQMEFHLYYMMPVLPVLLLLAVLGAHWLRQRQTRPAFVLLALLLVAQPILAFTRIAPTRWMRGARGVPPELFNPDTRAQLQAASPNTLRCLVGPDDSGCIYFYFLHKKGHGFSLSADLFIADSTRRLLIDRSIAGGARYLYTSDSTLVADPRLQPYVRQQVQKTGDFYVLELQAPQPK